MKSLMIIAVLLILVYLFWFLAVNIGSIDVSHFKGDGQIKPVGQGFWGKGLELELPSVNLGHKIFSIKDLPVTQRDYFIYTDLNISNSTTFRIAIKIIDNSGGIITTFEINKNNAICTSYQNNTKLYYALKGYIPKDKVGAVDNIVIDRIDGVGNQAFRLFLRSGGNI